LLKNNLDFKHNETIIKKGLTTLGYFRILGIIGHSEKPLDNNQIIANFKKIYGSGSWDKYNYEILKKLSPNSKYVPNELLFTWEDLKILEYNQLKEKCHNILQKIHQPFNFKIDNHLKENYIILMDGESLNVSNKWVIIEKNDKNSNSFNPYLHEEIIIIIYDKLYNKSKSSIFPILTIKKKGKIHVYSKSYTYPERRQFLNTLTEKQINFLYIPGQKSEKNSLPRTHQILKEICDMGESISTDRDIYFQKWFLKYFAKSKNQNLQIDKKFLDEYENMKVLGKKTDELNRIIGDREYFSYSLNFKGLLLFLILYGSIKQTKSDEIVFNKVLSNPSVVEIAPFLKYLNEFEKFGFRGKELAVTIAEELRNQLHLDIKNGTILLERAIERYYKEVEEYFKEYEKYFKKLELVKLSVTSEDVDNYKILQNKIKDYRKIMVTILRDFIKHKEDFYSFMLSKPNHLKTIKY
jgi:hypothetical protein